jgi:hypothetical protein
MTENPSGSAERVRKLNDAFRRSFAGGVVAVTAGVEALPRERRAALLAKVRAFDAFTEDNDPHGEHDFGLVECGDIRCLWKIEYYDREMELMSPDPADAAVTTRVLTLMLADEY